MYPQNSQKAFPAKISCYTVYVSVHVYMHVYVCMHVPIRLVCIFLGGIYLFIHNNNLHCINYVSSSLPPTPVG